MNNMMRALFSVCLLALVVGLSGCMLLDTMPNPNHNFSSGGGNQMMQSACSGCGGSGRGSDFLSRQGLPQAPGYSQGRCPRCNGTGRQ